MFVLLLHIFEDAKFGLLTIVLVIGFCQTKTHQSVTMFKTAECFMLNLLFSHLVSNTKRYVLLKVLSTERSTFGDFSIGLAQESDGRTECWSCWWTSHWSWRSWNKTCYRQLSHCIVCNFDNIYQFEFLGFFNDSDIFPCMYICYRIENREVI